MKKIGSEGIRNSCFTVSGSHGPNSGAAPSFTPSMCSCELCYCEDGIQFTVFMFILFLTVTHVYICFS